MGTGTGPVHFQKVQHYAFIGPEFFLTSLHPTPPFPGLQGVLLGIERGGLLGRSKGGTGKGVSLSNTVPSGKRDEGGGLGNWPQGSKAQRWLERGKDPRGDVAVSAQRKSTLVPPGTQVWSCGGSVG